MIRKNKGCLYLICFYSIMFIVGSSLAIYTRDKNVTSYSNAKECIENGMYREAISHIRSIPNYQEYKDCGKLLDYAETGAKYSDAINLYNKEEYTAALTKFEAVEPFKESDRYIKDIKYILAVKLFNKGEYRDSEMIFAEIWDYKDSQMYIDYICMELLQENIKTVYLDAVAKYENQEYDDALESLYLIESHNYKDTKKLIKRCNMKTKGD